MVGHSLFSVIAVFLWSSGCVQAVRHKNGGHLQSMLNVTDANKDSLSPREIAEIVAEKVRPPVPLILGEVACEDWQLFSLAEVNLPYRLKDNARLRTEFQVQATLQPTGRVLRSALVQGRKGNPNFHFYFNPRTTGKIEIEVLDHWDPTGMASPYGEWTVELKETQAGWATGPFDFAEKGYWAKTMQGEILKDAPMAAKVKSLADAGIELTDTFAPFYDGPSTLTEWNEYRKHVQKWVAYRAGGTKEEESPGQDMLEAYEDKCFDEGCKLSPYVKLSQTRVIGYDYAVRAMKAMGPQLQCNNRFRRNELGSNILNGKFWPEKPNHGIGLADSVVDHAVARPFMYRLVGTEAANRPETLQLIEEKAKLFLSKGNFKTDESLLFATKVNHRLHVFTDLSDEDAAEFAGSQASMLAEIVLPETFAGVGGWIWSNQDFKNKYMTKYKEGLTKGLAEDWTSLSQLQQNKLVSNLMDSLLFAGGLSVPTVIQQAFSVLYGEWGLAQLEKHHGADWVLTDDNVEAFVHESFRRFPAVGAFPFWDRDTNSHTQIDLRAANLQKSPAGWGDSAMDFKLRSIQEYKTKQISWANMAMVNDDPSHPESHSCPGYQLSLNTMIGLFKEFIRTGGTKCWKADLPKEDIKVNAGSSTAFTLTREPGCEA